MEGIDAASISRDEITVVVNNLRRGVIVTRDSRGSGADDPTPGDRGTSLVPEPHCVLMCFVGAVRRFPRCRI